MTNVLPQSGSITIDARDARALLGARDGAAALLYLYILANGGAYRRESAVEALGFAAPEVERAMAVLARLGLVSVPAAPEPPPKPPRLQRDALPQYPAEDLARELTSGSFGALVDEVQRALGRLLSSDGLMTLFGIYDYLGFPPEVILLLVNYSVAECAKRDGGLRPLTMRYVERVAFTWERLGLFTLEKAEAYLRSQEERGTAIREFRKILGMRDREPSVTERQLMSRWAEQGLSPELVSMAYDRTCLQIHKPSVKYMDRILADWYAKGLDTVSKVMAADPPRGGGGGERKPVPASVPHTGDGDEVAELQRFIESMKQNDGAKQRDGG